MTQENEKILLKDLCMRLPYGVKYMDILNPNEQPSILQSIDECGLVMASDGFSLEIENVKPFLFPLSSMTEEQKIECFKGTSLEIDKYGDISVKDDLYGNSQYTDLEIYLKVIDWFNKNHFDYRGLIPMGLAIDCANLNIY